MVRLVLVLVPVQIDANTFYLKPQPRRGCQNLKLAALTRPPRQPFCSPGDEGEERTETLLFHLGLAEFYPQCKVIGLTVPRPQSELSRQVAQRPPGLQRTEHPNRSAQSRWKSRQTRYILAFSYCSWYLLPNSHHPSGMVRHLRK